MNHAERIYYLVFGILLYLCVSLLPEVLTNGLSFIVIFLTRSATVIAVMSIALQALFFLLTAALSIVLVVLFLNKRSQAAPRLPHGLLIALLILAPVLYLLLYASSPVFMYFTHQILAVSYRTEYYTATMLTTYIVHFLRLLLLSALAVIVVVKSKKLKTDEA